MTLSTPRFAAAFAGVLLWLGGAVVSADEAAASDRAGDACRIVAPRYEPKAKSRLAYDEARFSGGAKLHAPVAVPCPKAATALDV